MNLSGDRPQGRGETGVGGPAAVTATGGRRVPVVVWLYVAVAGSVVLRAVLLDFESADYRNFLSAWYDYLVEHGRWRGLATGRPHRRSPTPSVASRRVTVRHEAPAVNQQPASWL